MSESIIRSRPLFLLNGIMTTAFIAGLVFSWRAVSSISTAGMIISGLFATTTSGRNAAWGKELTRLLIASILFYLAEVLAAVLHPPFTDHLHNLQVKSSLLFLPIACYVSMPVMQAGKTYLLRAFCILLTIASVYCLTIQFLSGHTTELTNAILYHELVSPIGQHAVLFSLYIFLALIILTEDITDKGDIFPFLITLPLILFFCLFLFLLSSKLVILLCLGYFFYKLFSATALNRNWKNGIAVTVIIAGVLLLATPNRIQHRFRELATGNIALLRQQQFSPDIYFNAWEFRLLQFRFVPEILNEQQGWITGTGPGHAQMLLDKKYTDLHMYQGVAGSGKKGYLGYHTHDQWLQSLLEAGSVGLIAFLGLLYFLIRICIRQRSTLYTFMTLSLIAFSFTDAVLASQYGIMLFLFFIHFFYTKPGTNT